MRRISLFLFIILVAIVPVLAQDLDSLRHASMKVFFSKGQQSRAESIARLAAGAMQYYDSLLHFRPHVKLLVLTEKDWPHHTSFPVYGMPHYTSHETLVVASSDNAMWKSFIPPLEQLPPALAAGVRRTYQKNGQLTMESFFDLLALHELGHAYHKQADLVVQRKWMGELFCNIFLHTYIAERQPDLLPALTVFPDMVVAGGSNGFEFTTLSQFESHYNEIGTRHPRNYGWYQCRLHKAAAGIYDAGSKEVMPLLWKALQAKGEVGDREFAHRLSKQVHDSVGDVWLKW